MKQDGAKRRVPRGKPQKCISIEVPGGPSFFITHLLLDFNGTLAKDGTLLPGVEAGLVELSRQVQIRVLTADTHGTAKAALSGLPVQLQIVATGAEKVRALKRLRQEPGTSGVAAIGNGANDVAMLRGADLGIAVIGPEGMVPDLVKVADVLAACIQDALELLLHTKRIVGTLRG